MCQVTIKILNSSPASVTTQQMQAQEIRLPSVPFLCHLPSEEKPAPPSGKLSQRKETSSACLHIATESKQQVSVHSLNKLI